MKVDSWDAISELVRSSDWTDHYAAPIKLYPPEMASISAIATQSTLFMQLRPAFAWDEYCGTPWASRDSVRLVLSAVHPSGREVRTDQIFTRDVASEQPWALRVSFLDAVAHVNTLLAEGPPE